MREGVTDSTEMERRSVLACALPLVVSLAGCLGGDSEETKLREELDGERTFTFDSDGDTEIEIQVDGESSDSTAQIELEKPDGEVVEEALSVGRSTITDAPVDGEYRLSVDADGPVAVEVLVR